MAPAEKEYSQEVQANITARIRAALTSSIFGLFCDNCQGRYCLNICLLSTVSEAVKLVCWSFFLTSGTAAMQKLMHRWASQNALKQQLCSYEPKPRLFLWRWPNACFFCTTQFDLTKCCCQSIFGRQLEAITCPGQWSCTCARKVAPSCSTASSLAPPLCSEAPKWESSAARCSWPCQ